MYNWTNLLYTWNIVKQLYFNEKKSKKYWNSPLRQQWFSMSNKWFFLSLCILKLSYNEEHCLCLMGSNLNNVHKSQVHSLMDIYICVHTGDP